MEYRKDTMGLHFYRFDRKEKNPNKKVLHVLVNMSEEHCLINNLPEYPEKTLVKSDQVEFEIQLRAAMVYLGLA